MSMLACPALHLHDDMAMRSTFSCLYAICCGQEAHADHCVIPDCDMQHTDAGAQ